MGNGKYGIIIMLVSQLLPKHGSYGKGADMIKSVTSIKYEFSRGFYGLQYSLKSKVLARVLMLSEQVLEDETGEIKVSGIPFQWSCSLGICSKTGWNIKKISISLTK